MKKVTKQDFPISTHYEYKIEKSKIILNLEKLVYTSKDHIKNAKNSIIWSIILFSKYKINEKDKLETMVFEFGNNKKLEEIVLPLLQNQMKLFNISFPQKKDYQNFKFKSDWLKGIKRNLQIDLEELKEQLREYLNDEEIQELQFYKTVTGKEIQIRFRGFQVGTWTSKNGFITQNDKEQLGFEKWIKNLMKRRLNPNDELYLTKEEHYLESILLKRIFQDKLNIGDLEIEKPFKNSSLAFQFPALMYDNDSNVNRPTYIDIIGKSKNDPVLMELKIWKKSGNSRGQYIFEGISQLLCYYNYLLSIYENNDSRFFELEELCNLNWRKPKLLLICNDIGIDDTGRQFIEYISKIKSHLKKDIDFRFVEIDHEKFRENRVVEFKHNRLTL